MARGNGTRWAAVGFAAGLTVGLVYWSRQVQDSRRQLFSRSPIKRLAALSWLRSHPSVDGTRLLRDYISWESRPVLRRRGELALRRMEQDLE